MEAHYREIEWHNSNQHIAISPTLKWKTHGSTPWEIEGLWVWWSYGGGYGDEQMVLMMKVMKECWGRISEDDGGDPVVDRWG